MFYNNIVVVYKRKSFTFQLPQSEKIKQKIVKYILFYRYYSSLYITIKNDVEGRHIVHSLRT